MRLSWLGFDDWIRHLFDHPASGPQWYFEVDAPFWDGPPALTLAHMTRLFDRSVESVADYSDAQINQGLWYLLSEASYDVLGNAMLPEADRARCVAAMTSLFRDLFAPRCSSHLSHRSETDAGTINSVCYMWWDIVQLVPAPDTAGQRNVDEAALKVMAESLRLESMACQESALHGLGHWNSAYPRRVASIIDNFLEKAQHARPELLGYARSARAGCVL